MSWLREYGERAAATRHIVCFPHGGGSAFVYRDWTSDAPDVQVHGVQYPGRGDRFTEPLLQDVRTMAREAAADVVPLTSGPVCLFGHSLGAYVAYETALFLQAAGHNVSALFVSGARAPHDPARWKGSWADLEGEALLGLVAGLGGTEAELLEDEDLRRVLLPILRTDFRAAEGYRAEPAAALGCPVVALCGSGDAVTDPRDALMWSEYTRGGFASHTFAGGHFFPHGESRADVISMLMDHLGDRTEHGH
ncbi:thioesterase II family protein [Streptomyces sp. NPDC059918]|uniref:thioesterase II family protein n=1 Tax=unclassified Streptomyces TaxID=2593676 RepID=UPI00365A6CC6